MIPLLCRVQRSLLLLSILNGDSDLRNSPGPDAKGVDSGGSNPENTVAPFVSPEIICRSLDSMVHAV
jgi:hypothetical protein